MRSHTAFRYQACVWLAGATLISGWALQPAAGNPAADKRAIAEPEQLLRQAVAAGIAGQTQRRDQLLDKALQISPDLVAARSQLGQLKVGGQWLPREEVQKAALSDSRLQAYRARRTNAADNVPDQLALAQWCAANQLRDEAQAHFTKVLELQPGEPTAIAALGLQQHRGQWMTQQQIDLQEKIASQAAQDLAAWKPQVQDLVKRCEHGSATEQESAKKELGRIQDPAAIPALEGACSKAGIPTALQIVTALQAMPQQSATEALLRQAVLHRAVQVRDAAAEALTSRSLPDFVPILLAGLRGKITTELDVKSEATGLRIEKTVRQDGAQTDRSQRSEIHLPTNVPNPYMNFFVEDSLAIAAKSSERSDRQAKAANRANAASNDKICKVLTKTTGQDLDVDPRAWWDWWLNYTEIYASGERPKNETYVSYQYNVPYYAPMSNSYQLVAIAGLQSTPPRFANGTGLHSYCFTKDTKVLTITGPMEIGDIQTGDRVLAQDPQSGELAYKPVFRTTLRPMRPMVSVHVGAETITATRGHLFWVTDVGWKMAKDLQPGDQLYGIDGQKMVDSVDDAPAADAYNLVLADFGTYFVGDSAILVHDNTERMPIRARVPGLLDP